MMIQLRQIVQKSRLFLLSLLLIEVFYLCEGLRFVEARQEHRANESRLEEIATFLGLPVDRLRPDHVTFTDRMKDFLGVEEEDPVKAAGVERLRKVLRQHEEQLASNPYRPKIEQARSAHAPSRIEGLLKAFQQLVDPWRPLSETAQQALLRGLSYGLEEDLALPPSREDWPGKAQARHAAMQARLEEVRAAVRPIVQEIQDPKMRGTLAQKIGRLKNLPGVELSRATRAPRFVERPLPIHLVEAEAPTRETTMAELLALPAVGSRPPTAATRKMATPVAPEITELAERLEHSPREILAFVHDRIEWDPKWGVTKTPVGTLWEEAGTAWDQAWLVHELLRAGGVESRIEWGEILIDARQLVNITGIEDPRLAGDYLATSGTPIVLLTEDSKVIAAQIGHAWVKAHLDYIPNRGAFAGPGDTWVRLDGSLTRNQIAEGIEVHDQVPFSLGAYLLSGTELSPRRYYEDALWSYIRANNIRCSTLEQLKRKKTQIVEDFAYVPGTLRAKVLQVDGEEVEVPAELRPKIELSIREADGGAELLTWGAEWPSLYGRRVEIAWPGASADDEETLAIFGDIFETPPYLVELRPSVRVDGVEMASGAGVGSAEEIDLFVKITPPAGESSTLLHQLHAGEHGVLMLDFGALPQALLDRQQQALSKLDPQEALEGALGLELIGTTYLYNLGRDLEDLAGWTWQRLVNLGTEGLILQTGVVTTDLAGAPLSFRRSGRFVDIASMPLGLVGVRSNSARPTLELAGAQGSFLEGQVFDQVVERGGISAVSALTRARRSAQEVFRIEQVNLEEALAEVELAQEIEEQIRLAVRGGQVAWVSKNSLTQGLWQGVGYILQNPLTGEAAFLLSGGYAGGTETGALIDKLGDVYGDEPWLTNLLTRLKNLLAGQPQDNSGSTNHGDPVNLSTGNYWRTERDLVVRALGIPILWERTYNSRNPENGPFGVGWSFTYGESLVRNPDGTVVFREGDGTQHLFTLRPGGGHEPPPGKHWSLVEDMDSSLLRTQDGVTKRFDRLGRLMSTEDLHGNRVTLEYDSAENLHSVIDAAGRTALTVVVQDGRIVEIQDLAGRKVSYQYDDGRLIRVVDSAEDAWDYSYDEADNLVGVSNPAGGVDNYMYDSLDRCVAHIDARGEVERYAYSPQHRRSVVTDRRGHSTAIEYDERGRTVVRVDPLGNTTRSTWDDDNNHTVTVHASGATTLREFDATGNLVRLTGPDDEVWEYTYRTDSSRATSVLSPFGVSMVYEVDNVGNLTQVKRQAGDVETLLFETSYDSRGLPVTQLDAGGNLATFEWDPTTGTQRQVAFDGSNDAATFEADALGRLQTVRWLGGHSVSFTWDDKDRIVEARDSANAFRSVEYDPLGRPLRIADQRGEELVEYDLRGQPTRLVDRSGAATTLDYDSEGNIVGLTTPSGNTTRIFYDALGRVIAVRGPDGATWTFQHCGDLGGAQQADLVGARGPMSGLCELTNPLGETVVNVHDEMGRLVQARDPEGHSTSYSYNAVGQVDKIMDPLGRITRYIYGPAGQLGQVLDAQGNETFFEYDQQLRLIAVVDANGKRWVKELDHFGRLVNEVDPLGRSKEYSYTEDGKPLMVYGAGREARSYQYSGEELVASEATDGPGYLFELDPVEGVEALQSADSEVVRRYDVFGRVIEERDARLGHSVMSRYDVEGKLVEVSGPWGVTKYAYSPAGALVELADSQVGRFQIERDLLGRRAALVYPNGATARYTYTPDGRLESLVTWGSDDVLIDAHAYEYDAVGNVTRQSGMDGLVITYQYDMLDRLARVDRNDGSFEAYTYDAIGNRLTLETPGQVVRYEYDDAGQLLAARGESTGSGQVDHLVFATYEWDDNGRLVTREIGSDRTDFQWNAFDQLVSVAEAGKITNYAYDGEGRRVVVRSGDEETRFLYFRGRLVGEYDQTGQLKARYLHGPRIDEPLAFVDASGEPRFLHRDALSSITAVTDRTGERLQAIEYKSFGEVLGEEPLATRFGYTSREHDVVGLYYYRARYYDPSIGRFLSRDPLPRSPVEGAGVSPYAYVLNNPIRFVDPSGLREFLCQYVTMAMSVPPSWPVGVAFGFDSSLCRSVEPVTPNNGYSYVNSYGFWGGLSAGFFLAMTYAVDLEARRSDNRKIGQGLTWREELALDRSAFSGLGLVVAFQFAFVNFSRGVSSVAINFFIEGAAARDPASPIASQVFIGPEVGQVYGLAAGLAVGVGYYWGF